MTKKDCVFYTMLFIANEDITKNVSENGSVGIKEYINCCKLLFYSLKKYGFKLVVLSNLPEFITRIAPELSVEKVDFTINIPSGIKFYAAHHKIDVFKYLSVSGADYSILIDNDVVCINDIPENFEAILHNELPIYYDITDQVYPAYGRNKIINDKEKLMKCPSVGNWAGGELIGGTRSFFGEIYNSCMAYLPCYVDNISQLFHNGDEMLTSCAIEKYLLQGHLVFNFGSIGGIARHWSVKTLHKSKPFAALKDCFLLHLPADKKYLASHSLNNCDTFLKNYSTYLKRKSILNGVTTIKRIIKKIMGK